MRERRSIIGAVVCVAAMLAFMPGTAMAQEQANAAGATPEPLLTACNHLFGAGNLVWCVSNEGNLVRFTSPAGFEHIAVGGISEGYVVCTSATGNYWDTALSASGWGPPIVLALSGSGITIRRTTTDGRFQLDQKWSRDNLERDLTVMMSLTNFGATQNVFLLRTSDPDVDNDFSDDRFDKSAHAGWTRDFNAVTMSNLTLTVPHSVIMSNPAPIVSSCSPAFQVGVPGGPGDPGISILYNLGTMATGKKKVVRVSYRAQ